jgi:D-arabinose 1-dehydrogenase-like Zn-dependent alcohol dehydrogenase
MPNHGRSGRLGRLCGPRVAHGDEFLALAPTVPVRTDVETFELEEANDALDRLRRGALPGAAVLLVP